MSAARRKLTKNFIKSDLNQLDIYSSIIRRWWYWRSLVLVDPWYWYFKPRRQTCRANDTNFSTSLSGSVLRLRCVPFTFPATLVFPSLFTLNSLYSFSVDIELSFGCSVAMNFCILCGCNFEIYWIVMKCLSFVRHKITSSIFINDSKQKDIKLLFAFKLKCKNWNSKVRVKIHKSVWNPVKSEALLYRKDSRQESAEYDKHTIGIVKYGDKPVDHMPIELSNLIDNSCGITEGKSVSAIVTGWRKREVGLLVPAKYSVFSKDLKTATILQQENILKKKSNYSDCELGFSVQKLVKTLMLRKE